MKAKITTKEQWEKRVGGLWPSVKGSLVEVRKPCIRPNCQACREGKKHPAWLFSYSEGGKRRCMYVPLEMVKTMQQAVKNGRQMERLLFQMGPNLIQEHRKSVKASKKPKA